MQNILEILGFCHTGILSGWVCVFLHFVLNWDSVFWDFVRLGFHLTGILSDWDFISLGFCLLGFHPLGLCLAGHVSEYPRWKHLASANFS